MMSYLIFFSLIAMIIYYGYSAFKIVKNFIDKKRSEKRLSPTDSESENNNH